MARQGGKGDRQGESQDQDGMGDHAGGMEARPGGSEVRGDGIARQGGTAARQGRMDHLQGGILAPHGKGYLQSGIRGHEGKTVDPGSPGEMEAQKADRSVFAYA